jgi:hypothetical protein
LNDLSEQRTSELNLHVSSVGFVNLKQFFPGVTQHPSNEHIWNLLDPDIKGVHRVIVKFPAVSDLIFDFADPFLKLGETSVGF